MQLILTTNRNKQLGFSQSDIHIHLISTRILPVIIIKKTTDPEFVRKIFSSFSNHLKERCIMSNAHTFASRVTNAIVLRENICSLAYSEVCVGIRNFRIRRFKLNLEIKSVQQIMVVVKTRTGQLKPVISFDEMHSFLITYNNTPCNDSYTHTNNKMVKKDFLAWVCCFLLPLLQRRKKCHRICKRTEILFCSKWSVSNFLVFKVKRDPRSGVENIVSLPWIAL